MKARQRRLFHWIINGQNVVKAINLLKQNKTRYIIIIYPFCPYYTTLLLIAVLEFLALIRLENAFSFVLSNVLIKVIKLGNEIDILPIVTIKKIMYDLRWQCRPPPLSSLGSLLTDEAVPTRFRTISCKCCCLNLPFIKTFQLFLMTGWVSIAKKII